MNIRKATMKDIKDVFRLSNDTEVRRQSLSTKPIAWDTHVAWFTKKISDPQCDYYIVKSDKTMVGQVRFDSEDYISTISISISKEYRGKRLAVPIILFAVKLLKRDRPRTMVVRAWIKPSNTISIRTFKRCGFGFNLPEIFPVCPLLSYKELFKIITSWITDTKFAKGLAKDLAKYQLAKFQMNTLQNKKVVCYDKNIY